MNSQSKLLDFTLGSPFANEGRAQNLYQELESSGYVYCHKARVLKLLFDLKPHSSDEVAKTGGKQYNARILELRREGWEIIAVRNGRKFDFTLLNRNKRW